MKRIILTGGGTAGHVTPNIALLPRLRELQYDIHYIGSYNGMEKQLVEQQGWRSEMKNGKRPTKAQKKILAFYGFHPEDWLISKNTSTELVILHRYTERTRHIPKHRDTEIT